jgi:hypothetical protein
MKYRLFSPLSKNTWIWLRITLKSDDITNISSFELLDKYAASFMIIANIAEILMYYIFSSLKSR